jgi:hypothetical protein
LREAGLWWAESHASSVPLVRIRRTDASVGTKGLGNSCVNVSNAKVLVGKQVMDSNDIARKHNEKRNFHRCETDDFVWLIDAIDCRRYLCAVHNISVGGITIELPKFYELSDCLSLNFESENHQIDCRIVWRSKSKAGIEFL